MGTPSVEKSFATTFTKSLLLRIVWACAMKFSFVLILMWFIFTDTVIRAVVVFAEGIFDGESYCV